MRLSRAVLSAAIIAPLASSAPAWSFSVTDGGGLNSGPAPRVAGPNEPKEHIANGGNAISGPSDNSAIASSGSSSPAGQPTARWSDSWFDHAIIIGGGWKYPPSNP